MPAGCQAMTAMRGMSSAMRLCLLTISLMCQNGRSLPIGFQHGQDLVLSLSSATVKSTHRETTTPAVSNALLMSRLVMLKVKSNISVAKKRRRRYDYEDIYEWSEDDTSLNYELEEVEEPSLLLKIARNWRTAGLRLVFVGAFAIMFTLIWCGICRVACKYWCKSLCEHLECCGFPGVKKLCQYCYSDPMYERVKELGDVFGIKISYAMYEKIKDHYIDDSELGWGMS